MTGVLKATNVAGVRHRMPLELDIPDLPGALCKGYEPLQDFHPTEPETNVDKAKALCAVCPERAACLAWVMEHELVSGQRQSGVWGGLTPWERAGERQKAAGDVKLCRKQRHKMVGDNVLRMTNGKAHCAACRRASRQTGGRRERNR